MLNHIKYPYRYSIHENQTDTALFYNEVPQALNNSLMYGLSADGKYYDVALMYNDGSFRKYNSTQEVAIVKNDEVHVGGVVVIEFFGGSNSIDIPLKSLRAIRLTEIPAHIAAWLTVELV